MTIDLHTAAHIGGRSEQQDAAGDAPLSDGAGSHLLVLADGVGGEAGGDTASQIAVDTFLEAAESGAFDEFSNQREALSKTLAEANRSVGASFKGVATTLVVAIVSKDRLRWLSVGDSHLYLIRGGKMRKLNEDHSVAHLMIKSGKHAAGDPALQEYRDVIASVVAGGEVKHIDLPQQPVHLQRGDIVLLASDGLDTVPHNRIGALVGELSSAPTQKIADILLAAVETERRVGQDNTTVIVARVEDAAAAPASVTLPRASRAAELKKPLALKADSHGAPALQSTPGALFAIAALVLATILTGGGWWVLSSPDIEDANQSSLASVTGSENPANTDAERAEISPRLATARTSKRVVPQNLYMFDCQIRIQTRRDPSVLLPGYCRRYFSDRQDIKFE